jgi:putative transposase
VGVRENLFGGELDIPIKKPEPEQIVALPRLMEVEIGNGKNTPQSCKEAEITVQTYNRWRREFSGLKLDQAKWMKELERANIRLKRLVAELSLEKQILKDVASKNF